MNAIVNLSRLNYFLGLVLFVTLMSSFVYADDLRLIREKTFQVKDWENVYVNASGADVRVESWDKQEVYVKIFANRRAEEKMNFDLYQEGEVVKVIAKRRGSIFNWFGGGLSVRIEIIAPKNYNPHVETSGGDISVANMNGGFKLNTSGGDVTLKNTNGKVRVETSGGDISLAAHKGEMQLSTSGGDIKCKQTKGDLNAETSGGDIILETSEGKVNAETSGGDIKIDYSGANLGLNASTSGGQVHVKIPGDFKANVHLETSGGGISNNFNNSRSEKVKRGEVDALFNGGGPKLNLETSGGDIIVDQK